MNFTSIWPFLGITPQQAAPEETSYASQQNPVTQMIPNLFQYSTPMQYNGYSTGYYGGGDTDSNHDYPPSLNIKTIFQSIFN